MRSLSCVGVQQSSCLRPYTVDAEKICQSQSLSVSAALATTLAQQYLLYTYNEQQLHTSGEDCAEFCSIAVLLPGYAATLAVAELLLSHHIIVCGLDRLVHASILDMLLLFAGVWSGERLCSAEAWERLPTTTTTTTVEVTPRHHHTIGSVGLLLSS